MIDQTEGLSVGGGYEVISTINWRLHVCSDFAGNWVLGIISIEHEVSRDCLAFEEIVLLGVCKLSNRGRQRSVLTGSWEVVGASMLLNEAIRVISQQCALWKLSHTVPYCHNFQRAYGHLLWLNWLGLDMSARSQWWESFYLWLFTNKSWSRWQLICRYW